MQRQSSSLQYNHFKQKTEKGFRRRNTITQLEFSKEIMASGIMKRATEVLCPSSW